MKTVSQTRLNPKTCFFPTREIRRNTVRWLNILFALALIGTPRFVAAAPVAEKKLRQAVEKWVRHSTADRRPDAVITRIEPYQENGATVAYVIHLAGGGYCLAGADSLVLPVYWYCPKGTYDADNPGCQAILKEIAARLGHLQGEAAKGGAAFKAHEDALAKRAAFWEELATESSVPAPAPDTPPSGADPSIWLVLPLTSQWDQGRPYNNHCPAALPGASNHTVVGCVATATAQVMNYWRWPNTGVGTSGQIPYDFWWTNERLRTPLANNPGISVTGWRGGRLEWRDGLLVMTGSWDRTVLEAAIKISNDPWYQNALGTLWNRLIPGRTIHSANFGATFYNWNLLEDVHTNSVDAGGQEVAKLSFHVGLAVNMNYGLLGSGANPDNIAGALTAYFRYDPDAVHEHRDIFRMIEEIRWQRPVLLGGHTATAGALGHRWVVYGYDLTAPPHWKFKMNMGWGVGSDGWYSVDDLNLDYIIGQTHVTRIAPLNVVRFVGADTAGDGSPSAPYRSIVEAVLFAPDHSTLIFKAGSINAHSFPSLVINRPLTLKGYQSIIRQ